jgi:uncharacterized protein (DUF111 family)
MKQTVERERKPKMPEKSAIAVYEHVADAEKAIHPLDQGGCLIDQASIVIRNIESEKPLHAVMTRGDVAKSGAATGEWVGGIEGVVSGEAGGRLLEALIDWGVSVERFLKYEEKLRAGMFSKIIHGNADEVDEARNVLKGSKAAEMNVHEQ